MLVTGGAGFIGSNFVRYILQRYADLRVVNLDRLTYAGRLSNLDGCSDNPRYQFVRGDICDQALVERLLREHEIDTIVHFAAESHVDRSISGPGAFVRTNVSGTFSLLEAARGYWMQEQRGKPGAFRFHHVSTDEVYGSLGPNDPAFTEETLYAPNSPYSASKAASDHFVRAYHHTYGLPVTTSNCSNNYGPFQHSEKFIPTVISACELSRPIPIYGVGSNVRDWLYVDDHCSGIDRVIRQGRLGETYNIGGNNEWANIDVVRLICRLMDQRVPDTAPHERLITFVPDRLGHDWRYAIDTSKIERELGWRPDEEFESGLSKTLDWHLAPYRTRATASVLH